MRAWLVGPALLLAGAVGCQGPAAWQPYGGPYSPPPYAPGSGYVRPPATYVPPTPSGGAATSDLSAPGVGSPPAESPGSAPTSVPGGT